MGDDPEGCALNADPQDQLTLLEVQQHDLEIDRAKHRRATLPEAARVAALESTAKALGDDITRAAVEVSDLEAEQRKADADVDLVRQRAEKDKALLETINDAKQLTNLQHELESLARRQAELEDAELEVMERLEAAQKSYSALLADRDTVAADLAEATVALTNAMADLADEEGIAAAARTAAAERVPADLLGLYDKLRADNAGIGAAALHRGRCEGCRIELTPVDLGRIREAPPAEVIRCEECRRILVRTAESGL